jgi:hypothetical protein
MVERVLFDLHSDPGITQRFRDDPESVLAGYRLSDAERGNIRDWNVRALSEVGVSDMLLMMAFTALKGQQGIPDYLQRMNMPAAS